uniref:Uncharacterized protein n=1 Tax=Arundo donax TaxID=35708 RepID=A0A0A9A0R2_ARUDO
MTHFYDMPVVCSPPCLFIHWLRCLHDFNARKGMKSYTQVYHGNF